MALAFNAEGERFEVPAAAAGWRVKRLRAGRGAPELVYGPDGGPLVLPVDSDAEDLREASGPGKYRLDLVDEEQRALKADAAYIVLHEVEPAATVVQASPRPHEPAMPAVLIEAMRQNTELARAVVDRFPAMMEASATLVRAADGAGLPARAPRGCACPLHAHDAHDEGDADDDAAPDEGDAPAPEHGLAGLVSALLPTLLAALAKGDLALPSLAEMLDWRRARPVPVAADETEAADAAPARCAAPASPRRASTATARTAGTENAPPPVAADAPAARAEAAPPATSEDALPPLSPQALAHFFAIQRSLTPAEAALARAAAGNLSPVELRAWFDELLALAVPDAVARVRTLLRASAPETAS